ncbi:sorting nexin-10A [Osmerus mordax]|uniref:sorting nexin-10A n=1 Tax=Osmerus mordax TaxID=8014 RepID=UPI00350ED3D1
MDGIVDSLTKTDFLSIWVRDPKQHKEDFWHTHVDYEIFLQTNSMCFRKKTSCVRRRYSEFVWLRQRLQDNALIIELPKLPPWNPFFSFSNPVQVSQRMKGMQEFLELVLQTPLLLSDSRLHLFLQSQLSMAKMEACARGQTRYTVAEAIQKWMDCHTSHCPAQEVEKAFCDSTCESTTSSGLGHSMDNLQSSSSPVDCDPSTTEATLFSCLSKSPCHHDVIHP